MTEIELPAERESRGGISPLLIAGVLVGGAAIYLLATDAGRRLRAQLLDQIVLMLEAPGSGAGDTSASESSAPSPSTALTTVPSVAIDRVRETGAMVVPTVSELIAEWRGRLDAAKVAFQDARAESERALFAQLEEAKQRGSMHRD